MIKIKNNILTIDKKSTNIDEINMIQSVKDKLYFSNNIVEISPKPYDINLLHKNLVEAGLENFILLDNVIVNLDNVVSLYIKYFQYAGISIFQCNKEDAEMYMLAINCRNGKTETISFRTWAEAEKCYHTLDKALTDLRNSQVILK